jgi:hypothetical protein
MRVRCASPKLAVALALPSGGASPRTKCGSNPEGSGGPDVTENSLTQTPPGGLTGREALGAYMQEQHEASPGMVVSATAEPERLGNRLRGKWAQYESGGLTLSGTDFVEFAADGRIQRLTMFFDSGPES